MMEAEEDEDAAARPQHTQQPVHTVFGSGAAESSTGGAPFTSASASSSSSSSASLSSAAASASSVALSASAAAAAASPAPLLHPSPSSDFSSGDKRHNFAADFNDHFETYVASVVIVPHCPLLIAHCPPPGASSLGLSVLSSV